MGNDSLFIFVCITTRKCAFLDAQECLDVLLVLNRKCDKNDVLVGDWSIVPFRLASWLRIRAT